MSAIREAGFGSDGVISASSTATANAITNGTSGSDAADHGIRGSSSSSSIGIGGSSTGTEPEHVAEVSEVPQRPPTTEEKNIQLQEQGNEAAGRGAAEMTTKAEETKAGQLSRGGATVTMRHLMAAARAAASRPGVTREMIKAYDRFAAGL